MATAKWSPPEFEPTYTRRGQVKQGCRDEYKLVDPSWLRRNVEGLTVRYSYWDGDTENHPGKWVDGHAPNLKAAKAKAKLLVERGDAKHGCRVYLVAYSWNVTTTSQNFHNVWDYGSYVPA